MKISIQVEPRWYVPDFEDNRDLDEPMEVLIQPLSRQDRSVMAADSLLEPGSKGEMAMRYKLRLISCGVSDVRNLTLEDEDGEERSGNVDDLIRYAPPALLTDIASAVEDASELRKGMRKN